MVIETKAVVPIVEKPTIFSRGKLTNEIDLRSSHVLVSECVRLFAGLAVRQLGDVWVKLSFSMRVYGEYVVEPLLAESLVDS